MDSKNDLKTSVKKNIKLNVKENIKTNVKMDLKKDVKLDVELNVKLDAKSYLNKKWARSQILRDRYVKNKGMFKLKSVYKPSGDQPAAIKELSDGIRKSYLNQTLLGVTGSGKTFTMANVIANINRPTLVLAHNKTLALQLYQEFKELFPDNAVEYFISYYDYYQPESYLPKSDTYIEKDSQINPKIEQMRLAATTALMSRNDVIVVSSVSCIYAIGDPSKYLERAFEFYNKMKISRKELLLRLINMQYERNDKELLPGRFRVRGDVIDVVPGYAGNILSIEMFGDEIDTLMIVDRFNNSKIEDIERYFLFPARHFVVDEEDLNNSISSIKKELESVLPGMEIMEKHRLKSKTLYDIEMLQETGFCKSIENYSKHFDGRISGEPPFTLLDYFPKDFLFFIDESHQTLPQVRGMYNGDRSRKETLIEYGFRLPSALDNRPLKFDEFRQYLNNTIFVSATPGDYELEHSKQIAEQIIRPTGLVDPPVEIKPIAGQMTDLIGEIKKKIKSNNRVLVTTLTKRLSEELTDYLADNDIKTRYMHSDLDTLERSEIIRQLRLGKFDVLVGINLLREGLDIPEVGMVAILDADKEGFLRDERSLIQTIGRGARNVESKVLLYADKITKSIRNAMDETNRRRELQLNHNKKYGITPKTIVKPINEAEITIKDTKHVPKKAIPNVIIDLESKMKAAAEQLEFESAIKIRDQINQLKKRLENQ